MERGDGGQVERNGARHNEKKREWNVKLLNLRQLMEKEEEEEKPLTLDSKQFSYSSKGTCIECYVKDFCYISEISHIQCNRNSGIERCMMIQKNSYES